MAVIKKDAIQARQHSRETTLLGTCVHCGADMFDGQPTTCCIPGLLGHLEAVLDHAAETLRRQ